MKTLYARASIVAAVIITGCSGGSGGNAGAADGTTAFLKAADALEKKLGAPGEKADMPPPGDPDVKAFDTEADRALTALGTPAMPVSGMDSYERLCGPAATITAAYVSAGTGPVGKGGLPTDDAAKVAKMNENASRYMDQMLSPLLYAAHCTAVHMPAIDKELAGRDVSGKSGALDKVRGGAYGQAAGLLQMAASAEIKPAQRARVVDLLVRDAGNFAIAFTAAQRRDVAAMVDQAAQAAPELKGKAGAIKDAVAKAPCGKLCSS
jgi:hypothetical protein